MRILPNWYLTRTLPAYHDGESGTVIEQTHKIYNAMNELINEYNTFVDSTNTKLTEFVEKYNDDIEVFQTSFRQEFQDFIDVIDLKILALQQEISEFGEVDLTPIQSQLDSMTNEINTLKQRLDEIDIEYAEKTGSENGYISVEIEYDEAGLPIYYPAFKNYEMESPVKLATKEDLETAINDAITSALEGNY